MQLVIEISDTLKNIADNEDAKAFSHIIWQALLMDAIKNGKPLPAGHGRLIDADELKKHKYHDSDRFENAVAVAQIDWAKTIVEADGGDAE